MKQFTFTKEIIRLAVLGISEIQYEILLALYNHQEINTTVFNSMQQLATHLKMSLPLVAYHIRGNKDSLGLVRLGLVNSKPNHPLNRTMGNKIQITRLGQIMLEERLRSSKLILRKEFIRGN